MEIEKTFQTITQNLEEVLTEKDLIELLRSGEKLNHYIGFEISGQIHLGNGLMTCLVVRDLQKVGVNCTFFLADWHTLINRKLGGKKEVIRKVAVGYFKEGLKISLVAVGGDPEKLNFILGSDLYHHNDEYWETFIKVCQNLTLSRVKKSLTIMGREFGEGIDFAMLLYPPLQVTDIFALKVNLAHGGTDQRKAHVLMREVGEKVAGYKAVAIHHHLLLGLQKPPVWPIEKEKLRQIWTKMKMSKSKPQTCVFIHDSPKEIKRKILEAFCPPKEINFNPILDWTKHLIFPIKGKILIKREKKYGGKVEYQDFKSLEKDYLEGKLHPADLKNGVIEALVEILEPIRKHFSTGKPRDFLLELKRILRS